MAVGVAVARKTVASVDDAEAGGSERRVPRADSAAGSDSRTRCPHPLGGITDPGTTWGLFGDFQACPRDFSGIFRRVSREGPDSAERNERAGQGLRHQHSMMFTARPPRAVSLYFTYKDCNLSGAVSAWAQCKATWAPLGGASLSTPDWAAWPNGDPRRLWSLASTRPGGCSCRWNKSRRRMRKS